MSTGKIVLKEFQLDQEPGSPVTSKKKKNKDKNPEEKYAGCKIEIINMDDRDLEIDFIGFHISLVNAYRRIVLAEVATMAIEKVYMYNNTSIVQDEVLAHRLGLVPLKVDPRFFEFRNKDETEWGAQDSVKYELKVKCSKKPGAAPDETDPDNLYVNRKVLSSSLKWEPLGNQTDIFQEANMQPLHQDILLAKMNSGHEIILEAYAVKGIGSDHAKFQPGLSWYRLLPEIELTREVEGEQAVLLQKCFSPGVIEIDTTPEGKKVAKVADARNDACSRNVFQYDSIKDSVKLTRKPDHVIFYIESHSALKSFEILEESVNIMIGKCDTLLAEIDKHTDTEAEK
ncbi:DNA-directed RNA polymerases I and III subunit RPAC1 [Penaeus vannamei]|uniref:DNA-directed RNA polymerases I and III subunit RPAC1 n=1 Tax=Penaeus vannamei TaxID=6689 RepID=A0A3R7SQU8_PENVA|nr:DNA-directed RNA polymerases I and III subunit RPAC1-like [Penaeus vannamei]ROT71154.1 putative DNA-directed RNA polymerases I and III subunit RPAC1-like [Penaeus vannamei]